MNKRENKIFYFRCNFFPKNNRGQFFLIMAFIIIGLIAGLSFVTNSVNKKADTRFNYVKDELDFESEKIIDYGAKHNLNLADMKSLFKNFTSNYSGYSNADDFYFIFGTTGEITFAGLRKKSQESVNVDFSSEDGEDISLSQGVLTFQDFSNPTENGNLTINGVKYNFNLNTGQNFYFVVSKDIEGDVYIATNS